MSFPSVTIVNVDKVKISDEEGYDISTVSFKFDKDVGEFVVRVMGVSHNTGNLIIAEMDTISANTEVEANIHYTDLYQEGENRVNIYGKTLDGIWTPYNEDSELNSLALTFSVQ